MGYIEYGEKRGGQKMLILKDIGNDKVKVISVYRKVTGEGLKEAKDVIDLVGVVPDVEIPLLSTVTEQQAIELFAEVGAVVSSKIPNTIVKNTFDEAVLSEKNSSKEVENGKKNMPDEEQHASEILNMGTLGRDETLKNLIEAGKIAKNLQEWSDEKVNIYRQISYEKKEAEAIKNAISKEAKKKMWVIPLIVGIATVWMYGLGLFLGLILYFARKKKIVEADLELHKAENEANYQAYFSKNVIPLQERLDKVEKDLDELYTSGEVQWASDFVGSDMFEYHIISDLYDLIKSRRADNLKEALNLYDSAQHQVRMEEMQAAIQNASEIQAAESVKQTALSQQIEKNTHQTATAAKATAYHTRQIQRNTRDIQRNTKNIDQNTRRFR